MINFAAIHWRLPMLVSCQMFLAVAAIGAAPQLDYLFPAGAQQGAKDVSVTAGGKFENWPVEVWTNATDGWLRFVPNSDEKKKGQFAVTVAAECEPGAYLVRLHSNQGVSAARIFVVGTLPEELEQEPNDTFDKPQTVEDEASVRVINGQLEIRGDVDCFAFDLAASQMLVAEVAAYVLDSPVDPLLHVRGPEGYRVAFNHDAPGHLLDPRLTFNAPTAGKYVLELAGFAHPPKADIRLTGTAATRYRLTVSTATPLATHTQPLAVQRGTTREVTLFMSDGSCRSHAVNVPEEFQHDRMNLRFPGIPRPVAIRISEVCEHVEPLASLSVPGAVTGVVSEQNEIDRYPFVASKDVNLSFTIDAAVVGSALDPVLSIENAAGKELATNDDAAHRFDSSLTWKAPADGDYTASVRSRFRTQAGSKFFYRLKCTPAEPEVIVAAATDSVILKHGEKAELTLNVSRKHGHPGALTIKAQGLPEDIQISPTEIPADASGEWKLTLESSKSAGSDGSSPGASPTATPEPTCQPFLLTYRESETMERATLIYHNLKGTNADVGEMLINRTTNLWLVIEVK